MAEARLHLGDVLNLGLRACRTKEHPWLNMGGKGPTHCDILTWHRFSGLRIFRKTMAKRIDALAIPERYTTLGKFQLAEEALGTGNFLRQVQNEDSPVMMS